MKLLKVFLLVSASFLPLLLDNKQALSADMWKLTFGTAKKDGVVEITLKNTPADKPPFVFSADIKKDDTGEKKAQTIKTLIEKQTNRTVEPQLMGNMLLFNIDPAVFKDSTKQRIRETFVPMNPKKKKVAKIDVQTTDGSDILASLDPEGNEPIFYAAFGFTTTQETVLYDVTLPFTSLSGNTLDDLMSSLFIALQEKLPTIYKNNLFLDLSKDNINFLYPTDAITSFAEVEFTADNSAQSIDVRPKTPEPSTLISFLALGTLGVASTLKRKLKTSKSSEKKTEKVS